MTILAPAEQLKLRRDALTHAVNTFPEGAGNASAVKAAAQMFYQFLTEGETLAPVIVQYPDASGMPIVEKPLPTDTICSAYAAQLDTGHLHDLRHQRVAELHVLNNELKQRGVQPA